MQTNRSAIQLIGFIMSKQTLDVNYALDLIQILNTSPASCRDIVTILEDIFKHEKSGKILVAVQALQYFVKNCNINFHNASNRQSFQKRLLSLLNRIRGKTSLIKQLNSNTDNWCRIEAKVLYIVQLWYDALMIEENKYTHIINTYKVLRKENVTFPPRSKNQKNLLLIETESPIFDNIEQIAQQDQKKFNKKLAALGMKHLQTQLQKNIEKVEHFPKRQQKTISKRQVNIDEISQKIAIIQSTQNCTLNTLKVIEDIKKAIQFGTVKPNQQSYWKQIKTAAYKLVEEWQVKNAELVKQQELNYLQKKMGMMGNSHSSHHTSQKKIQESQQGHETKPQTKAFDLLDAFDDLQVKQQQNASNIGPTQVKKKNEVDLLDLL